MESQVQSPRKSQALDLKTTVHYGKLVALAEAVNHLGATMVPLVSRKPEELTNPTSGVYEKICNDPSYADIVDVDFLKNYKLLYNVQMNDDTIIGIQLGYYGFIAQNKNAPYNYVMAIRGTQAAVEWFDDALINPLPFKDVANGGQVAAGFLALFESGLLVTPPDVKNGTLPLLKLKDVAANPTWAMPDAGKVPTVISGHSLGSALATLYAISTANNSGGQSGDLSVYTFASPMVGDQTFANTYNNSPLQNYRICNIQDKIPTLPIWPIPLPNVPIPPNIYEQVGGEYPIDSSKYPEIYNKLDTKEDQQKAKGCAHVLPTYLYVLEKMASMNPNQDMLNADGCGCLSK